MKFYITGAVEHVGDLRKIADYFEAKGWQPTTRQPALWLDADNVQKIVSRIKECDLFFLLLPSVHGSDMEFTLALGMSKPVIILSPHNIVFENSIYSAADVTELLIDKDSFVLACQAYKTGKKMMSKIRRKSCKKIPA